MFLTFAMYHHREALIDLIWFYWLYHHREATRSVNTLYWNKEANLIHTIVEMGLIFSDDNQNLI